jgi:hypothetical protein
LNLHKIALVGLLGLIQIPFGGCSSGERGPVTVERQGQETAVEPTPTSRSKVRASQSGVSVVSGTLTVAALLENRGRETLADIELNVLLLDGAGKRLFEFGDNLPFCPPDTECWWGTRFPSDSFPDDSTHVEGVVVTVTSDGDPYAEGVIPEILEFPVSRNKQGIVRARAPRDEGMAFVLGFLDGRPLSGIGVNIFDRPGPTKRIAIADDILPRVATREHLRGFMYSFDLPEGS